RNLGRAAETRHASVVRLAVRQDSPRAKFYLRGTACTTAHAFSLRDARGNLLEEQGVFQADPRKTRPPLAGQPRSSILGEWERPNAWIEADVKRWKRQRQERRRELMGQATD